MELNKCVMCGRKDNLLEHHTSYSPEKKIIVCKSCHFKITKQIQEANKFNTPLCVNCGRHFTSNKNHVCWYCKPENKDKQDWFGLTSKDKTPNILEVKKCN